MRDGNFHTNDKGTDYFVGDIHGEVMKFWDALDAVSFDESIDRVFSVGDLIDRGPNSGEALRLLDKTWFHAVQGNHEDMLIGGLDYSTWMFNGGTWINEHTQEEFKEFKALVRNEMYDRMTVDTIYGRIGVVHAEWFGDWNRDDDPLDLHNGMPARLWGRSRIRSRPRDNSMVEGVAALVVGHTPLISPRVVGNTLYIDTGACFGHDRGYLTLLSVQDVFTYINNPGQ